MTDRYTRPAMREIWTRKRKCETWLKVEIAATEAWEKLGVVPEGTARLFRKKAKFNIKRIDEIEAATQHDFVAFTRCVAESLGPESKWLHYGLTSTDVVDTAQAINIAAACAEIIAGVKRLMETLAERAEQYKNTPVMGRTHGVHAEPTVFGLKFLLWREDMKRCLARLEAAAETMRVGKLSGAVGNYGALDPFIEKYVCEKFGLVPATVSTQILQRDRHAEFLCAIAITGACVEKIATEIRHLQRTELREAEEPFGKNQKGSSTMPHKRNPIKSENLCGLSRVLRGFALTALENVALWHERDISHSSAERIIISDSTFLLDYMLERMNHIIEGLLVYPENMKRSMEMSRGLVYAQQIMLALVSSGMTRESSYDLVQSLAMQAWQTDTDFPALLKTTPEITAHLPPEEINKICRPENSFTHIPAIYERAKEEG